MSETRSTLRRNRNFVLLFCAYGISAFGDHLSELGIMKEMGVDLGNDKTSVGAQMMFFFFLPYVLLGPLAGVVADRLPRRWILIATDLIRGLISLSIPFYIPLLADRQSAWMMLPIFGLGVLAAFFNPARQSLVPMLVEDDSLTRANSVLNGLAPIAAIISFVVGGWLAGQGWTTANFWSDAATFWISAICVTLIRLPDSKCSAVVSSQSSWKEDLRSGVRYIFQHRYVWQLLIFTAAFWTAAGAFSSMIPTVVFDWYGLEYDSLGIFRATLGVGMLLGALILTAIGDASRAHYNIIVGLIGVGLTILLFSLIRSPWLGGPVAVGVGLFGVWILISANTLLQRIVPNHTRGKVFGLVDLVNMAGMITATGILGIIPIPSLDSKVGWIMRGLGGALLATGLVVWRHHAMRSQYSFAVAFVKSVNEVVCRFWYRLRHDGYCTIPPDGPCIITSNHICGADPCFLIAANPNRAYGFMIAKEYYNLPIWKHLIQAIQCIPVRRDGTDIAATKEALRQLRAGKALGIFIEGRIPEPGLPAELRDGVAALALRSGAKVIPAHISGVKYHDAVIMAYLLRHRVRVKFGPPVDLSEFANYQDRDQLARATQKIWQSIQSLAPADGQLYI